VDGDDVIIANWGQVLAGGTIQDEEYAVGFKIPIAKPVAPEELGAGVLEVLPVPGVVQVPHRIAFSVPYTNVHAATVP
jgi:hypothetical protein